MGRSLICRPLSIFQLVMLMSSMVMGFVPHHGSLSRPSHMSSYCPNRFNPFQQQQPSLTNTKRQAQQGNHHPDDANTRSFFSARRNGQSGRRFPALLCWLRRCSLSTQTWSRIRMLAVALAVALLSFRSLPAQASSTTAMEPSSSTVTRVVESTAPLASSPELDEVVEKYVEQHMFDDDVPSPLISTYREAYEDATTREYPSALREVMGDEHKNLLSNTRKRDFGQVLLTGVRFLERKTGLSEAMVTLFMAMTLVLGGPFAMIGVVMFSSSVTKRRMNKEFKQRYGDSYSFDATLKPEETVEAPPDEDDEDDDDEDDDEEDDDDDDDDDDDE